MNNNILTNKMTANNSINIKNLPSSPYIIKTELEKYRIENIKLKNDLINKDSKIFLYQNKLNKAIDLINKSTSFQDSTLNYNIYNTISNKPDTDLFGNSVNTNKDTIRKSSYKEKYSNTKQIKYKSIDEYGKYEKIQDIQDSHIQNKLNNKQMTIRKMKDIRNSSSIDRNNTNTLRFSSSIAEIDNSDEMNIKRDCSYSKTNNFPIITNNKTIQFQTIDKHSSISNSVTLIKEENIRLKTKIEEMNISFASSIKSLTEIISEYERKNYDNQRIISCFTNELSRIKKVVLLQNETILKFKIEKQRIEEELEFYIKNIKLYMNNPHYHRMDQNNKDNEFIETSMINNNLYSNSNNNFDSLKEDDSDIDRLDLNSCLTPIKQNSNKFRKIVKSAINNSDIKKESIAIYNEKLNKHIQEYDDLCNQNINGIRISFQKVENLNIDYSTPFYIPSGEKNDDDKILNLSKSYVNFNEKNDNFQGKDLKSSSLSKDMVLDYEITKLIKENNFEVIYSKLSE